MTHVNIAFLLSYAGTPFKGSAVQFHHHPLCTVEGLFLIALSSKRVNLINCDLCRDFSTALQQYNSISDIQQQRLEQEMKKKASEDGVEPQYDGGKRMPAPVVRLPQLSRSVQLGRSSRTDKGVSALCNIINVNVKEQRWNAFGSVDAAMREINAAVADIIEELTGAAPTTLAPFRVQTAQPVPPSFAGRFAASSRLYRYLIPAFAFDPPNSVRNAPLPGSWFFCRRGGNQQQQQAPTQDELSISQLQECLLQNFQRAVDPAAPQWQPSSEHNEEETMRALQHYQTRIEMANSIIAEYLIGVHRFHNFTGVERKDGYTDAQLYAKRTVHACDCEAVRRILRCSVLPVPLMLPVSSTLVAPYFVFQIEGGSFLLHMIRKITGAIVAILRGARASLFADALSSEKIVNVPMAPARYLSLTRVAFGNFDACQARHGNTKFPVLSETVQSVEEQMLEFEAKAVFAEMAHLDTTGKSMWPELVGAVEAIGADNLQAGRPVPVPETAAAASKQDAAAVGGAATTTTTTTTTTTHSEMRQFIKQVSVHNWKIVENPERFRPVVGQSAKAEAKAKRRERTNDENPQDDDDQDEENEREEDIGEEQEQQGAASAADVNMSTKPAFDSWMTLSHLQKLNLLAL